MAAAVIYVLTPIPDPRDYATAQSSVVYYAGGERELGRFGEYHRRIVELERVPVPVRDAVIAAENRGFYDDVGISPKGVARAIWVNLTGGPRQGGSTITQQYVRNYYLTQDPTWSRKLNEAVLSIKINRQLSKDEILENYLNTIYFGRGAYGIQAAAQTYFGIDADELAVNQGAVLAALIASPGRYDPTVAPEALEARMMHVLDGMVEMGTLSRRETAQQELPEFVESAGLYAGTTGHILVAVEAELERRGVEPERIHAGGLRIETTLREPAQAAAVNAVESEESPDDADGIRIGLTAVEPGTGRIVAMYGGADYLSGQPHAQENNAAAKIRPGSTYKAFALAAALEEGFGLYNRFAGNSPLRIPGEPAVHNYNNKDWGSSVSLLFATQQSINTAYVDLCMRLGGEAVANAAERAGIPRADMDGNVNARLALGINSVSPMQMAGAYATFAARGVRVEPHLIATATGTHGDELEMDPISRKQAFDEDVAYDVTTALRRAITHGTAASGTAELHRPAAAKTGTHGGTDGGILTAWLVGYTPHLSAAVAMFKGDGTEAIDGLGDTDTGGGYPTRIWTAFMRAALAEEPLEDFTRPNEGAQPIAKPAPGPAATPVPARTPSPASSTSESPSTAATASRSPSPNPPPTTEPEPTATPGPSSSAEPGPTPSEEPSEEPGPSQGLPPPVPG